MNSINNSNNYGNSHNSYQVTFRQLEIKPQVDCTGGLGMMINSQKPHAVDSGSPDQNICSDQKSPIVNPPTFDFEGLVKTPNIELTVKNVDTLQQFTNQAHFDLDYIPKLQKWIDQKKFRCDEEMEDLQLQIGAIFSFTLPKSTKSDAELVREELRQLKREKLLLMRDFKLFQHYFFNFWRERSRDTLLDKDYLLDSIVESPQNLYNICDGLAFVDEEDLINGTRRSCFIGFRHPVAFLYHAGSGSTKSDENNFMVRGSTETNRAIRNGEEWFEVFISGKNFPYGLAHISSKVSKQIKVDLRKTLGMMADGDSLPQTAIIESAAAHQSSSGLMDQPNQVQYYLHRVDLHLV